MRVLFFASVRERLDCAGLELDSQPRGLTTDSLREELMGRGESWREVLSQPNLICAVNQTVVHGAHPLADDDEVAFFPPVTGG